ncbi:uncharacterized protein LOC120120779 [Hibiscus syriacus]|uniref:uncharacterized protein LOC120120779 n=1 Tax=Hibiscus syriacus TaxID=106335 RepID=UPI001924F7AB|nr:uncharacterized protein LOC120120779 [Hibiscus syriacus]
MTTVLVSYFTSLIGSADPLVSGCTVESLKGLLNYSLPAADLLKKEVEDMEIKSALFRQGKDKSSGPDGYTSVFFKAAWDIVGADFMSAARLVPFFPAMISQSQKAFVKGRNIVDNTLLAQEIVKGYSRKSLSPRCAIKIDMQKAFDSGEKGIRQGDPLSPYLFVMAMNVMSSLLDTAAKKGIFKFHPKCKRISLAHLCFADDLLVFCYGSLDAVLGVQSNLEKFYELSGLKLNAQKIEFFACGLNEHTVEKICRATGFRLGQLPVSYLGVPLVTRKLIGNNCAVFMFNYWSRQLILPKGIIRDIERLCMCFFWKGSDSSARGARVRWGQICTLKFEGGLGLKSLVEWSRACYLLMVRNILANEGSLWIVWIKEYCFTSTSYWEVVYKPHFSWILSKLLILKEEARTLFIPCADWSIINGKWIWDSIRSSRVKIVWHKLIWFPAHIPKFSLFSWMVILDRLPTKDRLARFGLIVDHACGLCGTGLESRDHLFVDCSYAKDVWNSILVACGLSHVVHS